MTAQPANHRSAAATCSSPRACGAFVAAMVGTAYAAVPLYDWFCRVTGFGGTTQVATSGAGQRARPHDHGALRRQFGPGLPWRFEPEQNCDRGQARRGRHRQLPRHQRDRRATITASAAYNVAPLNVGAYFQKINCFCFTEQRSSRARSATCRWCSTSIRRWPRTPTARRSTRITLSYTFYPQREPSRPVADNTPAAKPGRI